MAIWQWELLALGVLWTLQSLGAWYQMTHYNDVMKGITSKYCQGYVVTGNVRRRFGRGVIVLLVVTSDLIVQRLLIMNGRSVFARFARHTQFEGISFNRLRTNPMIAGLSEPILAKALEKAIDQVERIRGEPKNE